jgi:hypothetical protein
MSASPTPEEISAAALMRSFPLVLSVLKDAAGRPYDMPAHLIVWANLVATELRLVLRAPRSHGKTTLLLAYIAWRCWRHGRTETGRLAEIDPGPFEIVLFSATREQVLEHMVRFRDLVFANEPLFRDILPERAQGASQRTRWSATEVRFRNHARLGTRAYKASVRGMHPDVLLLDDVLNDANSQSLEQRERTLRYFMGTLLPMRPSQVILIGTAIHQADLLAHLGRGMGTPPARLHTALGFRVETYRALDEATGQSLWPGPFPASDLLVLRDADPLSFSREYQNDPRDDAASLFPFELTQRAIDAGASLTLGIGHPASDDEVVVLGVDVALSAAARADFTVVMVVAWNRRTGARRVLDMRRVKGLEFDAQIELICDLTARHRVFAGMVEDNGLQQWLLDPLGNRPETRGHIFGHRTGTNKANLQEGIPRLALAFRANSWIIPSGDTESLRLARQFQAELAAYGYRDGRYAGVGEHDDTVIAAWLVERTILWLEELIRQGPPEEFGTGEDLGIERVRIGDWDD